VPDQDGNPATVNDPALTAKMLPSLQAVVGAGNVYEPPLQMGAEAEVSPALVLINQRYAAG
jgi:amidohydrolase